MERSSAGKLLQHGGTAKGTHQDGALQEIGLSHWSSLDPRPMMCRTLQLPPLLGARLHSRDDATVLGTWGMRWLLSCRLTTCRARRRGWGRDWRMHTIPLVRHRSHCSRADSRRKRSRYALRAIDDMNVWPGQVPGLARLLGIVPCCSLYSQLSLTAPPLPWQNATQGGWLIWTKDRRSWIRESQISFLSDDAVCNSEAGHFFLVLPQGLSTESLSSRPYIDLGCHQGGIHAY